MAALLLVLHLCWGVSLVFREEACLASSLSGSLFTSQSWVLELSKPMSLSETPMKYSCFWKVLQTKVHLPSYQAVFMTLSIGLLGITVSEAHCRFYYSLILHLFPAGTLTHSLLSIEDSHFFCHLRVVPWISFAFSPCFLLLENFSFI